MSATQSIDREKFLDQGCLILRSTVPPKQLDELRLTAELLTDRSKAQSLAARSNGDPRGGEWYEAVQPRVEIDRTVDTETADIVDFLLGPTVRGVS